MLVGCCLSLFRVVVEGWGRYGRGRQGAAGCRSTGWRQSTAALPCWPLDGLLPRPLAHLFSWAPPHPTPHIFSPTHPPHPHPPHPQAFDDPEQPYLPDSVLFRQKEQFSDGVGYDWVDGLKEYAGRVISDDMWENRGMRFQEHTPRTREYYLLRSIFESQFPHPDAIKTVPHVRRGAAGGGGGGARGVGVGGDRAPSRRPSRPCPSRGRAAVWVVWLRR